MSSIEEEILVALRRIIRATDLHSRELLRTIGLTMPQLLVLRAIRGQPDYTLGDIAKEVRLAQATVTSILKRLEARGLIARHRDTRDRRKSHVRLSEEGKRLLDEAPAPLQRRFLDRFAGLETWERHLLVSALQRVATLMNAEELEAAPLLDVGEPSRSGHPGNPA